MKVIITAFRGEGYQLLRALKSKGDFNKTVFRDVLLGEVKDLNAFLNELNAELPLSLSRVMPLDEWFSFKEKNDLLKELKNRLLKYAGLIKGSFRVTVERRGLKGLIDSRSLERELGELLFEHLKAEGSNPKVDLSDPDHELVVELLNNDCGITMLTKDFKKEYLFIRV